MNIPAFVAILLFGLFFHFGLSLYSLPQRRRAHNLALLMLVCLNCMILGSFFAFSASDRASFLFWLRVVMSFLLVYFPISFHFCLEITGILPVRKVPMALLYTQAAVFLYANWTGMIYASDFVREGGLWLMETSLDAPWFTGFSVVAVTISIGSLLLLHLWHRRATSVKQRRQALIMRTTLLVTLVLASLESLLIPALTGYRSLGLGSLLIGIWIGGILYCFLHYRFLNLTPDVVGHELVDHIADGLILLNPQLETVFINRSGEHYFGTEMRKKTSFFARFQDSERIKQETMELLSGSLGSLACRLFTRERKQKPHIFDCRISLVRDRFSDTMGVMIIASPVHQLQQLKELYKITSREREVIEHLISGNTNQQISDLMGISLRTVKTHITSIYMKLDVTNKVQLINKLGDYEVLPRQRAEKRLLVLQR